LTPERVKKVEAVYKIKLSPELRRWVNEYKKAGRVVSFCGSDNLI